MPGRARKYVMIESHSKSHAKAYCEISNLKSQIPTIPSLRRALCRLAAGAALLLFCGACRMVSVTTVVPARGILYTHFKAPLVLPDAMSDLDRSSTQRPSNLLYVRLPVPYLKSDITLGRVDLEYALRRAGIARLVYADYEYLSILGYYQSVIVHAYGLPTPPADEPAPER
jgi:hypothetical protein